MAPEVVAATALRGAWNFRRTVVPGTVNLLAAVTGKLLPWLGEFVMVKAVFEKLEKGQVLEVQTPPTGGKASVAKGTKEQDCAQLGAVALAATGI